MGNGTDQQTKSHTIVERQRQRRRESRVGASAVKNQRGILVPFHLLPTRLDHGWNTADSLHVGEDLGCRVRFPRLSVNSEQPRVGFHDRFECTEPRTCAKNPSDTREFFEKKNTRQRRKISSPASRPTTESFSQFEPEALTRYLKPIDPRVQRAARGICG